MTGITSPRETRAAGATVLTLQTAPKPKRTRKATATRRAAVPSANVHALNDYRRAPKHGAATGRLTITDFGDGQRDVAVSGSFETDPLSSLRALCATMFSIVRRIESDAKRHPSAPSRVHGAEYSLRDRQ